MGEKYQGGRDAVVRLKAPDNARATEGESATIYGHEFVGGSDGDFYATLPGWLAEAEISGGRVEFVRHAEGTTPTAPAQAKNEKAAKGGE